MATSPEVLSFTVQSTPVLTLMPGMTWLEGGCLKLEAHLTGSPSGHLPRLMGRTLPDLALVLQTSSGLPHPGDEMSLTQAEKHRQLR